MRSHVSSLERPRLRGYLHLVAALTAPFALLLLLLIADTQRAVAGAAIFGSSLILLYVISVAHHLLPLRPRLRHLVGRLDHSMIFVFIAATYTPFGLVLMTEAWGTTILSVVWVLAAFGVAGALTMPRAPRWAPTALYATIGLVGVAPTARYATAIPVPAVAMIVFGGLLYWTGGIVYVARRPNPLPRIFGYHEVFHALELGGTALFYSVLAIYVLPS